MRNFKAKTIINKRRRFLYNNKVGMQWRLYTYNSAAVKLIIFNNIFTIKSRQTSEFRVQHIEEI